MDEEWRPVKGYEEDYEVSNLGRVRSVDRYIKCSHDGTHLYKGRILRQENKYGNLDDNPNYKRVGLSHNGKVIRKSVHRLVAEAFLENNDPTRLTEVNHKNGIRSDNFVDNLEWVSREENRAHAVENGFCTPSDDKRQLRLGVTNGTILNDHDVCIARELYSNGYGVREITEWYGHVVNEETMRKAIDGRTYKHVTDVDPVPLRRARKTYHVHPNLRFTQDEEIRIAERYTNGEKATDLSKELGVSESCIYRIIKRQRPDDQQSN